MLCESRIVMPLATLKVLYLSFVCSDEELQEMIDEADRDGDGEINEDEFIRYDS